jgi:hypothetical protein
MASMKRRLFASILLLGTVVFANAHAQVRCAIPAKWNLKADWNPRTLAGEYRVVWVSDTGSRRRAERLRLFLWRASMRDVSVKTHKHPPQSDTLTHPLYGDIVPDSGVFTKERVRALKNAIDPIYPPVLVESARGTTKLLVGTVGNARDGTIGRDGGGIGMWVKEIDQNGFRGTFEPWGIVVEDKGHYCAIREKRRPL